MSKEGTHFIKAENFEEPSTISNVVDYLSSYMSVRNVEVVDNTKKILWSKFVCSNHNDGKYEHSQPSDAIMVVGTEGMIQVHRLGVDGKLSLVFSKVIERVNTATVLPSPQDISNDLFCKERPLIVVGVDCRLYFYSMRSGCIIKELMCKTEIMDICATQTVIVASSCSELVLVSATKLVILTTLMNCRPSTSRYIPVAHSITEHWLAYAEQTLTPSFVSVGGDLSESSEKPYALSLLDIKKKVKTSIVSEDGDKEMYKETGVVSILSLSAVLDSLLKHDHFINGMHIQSHLLVAHFMAHQWTPISRMVFDLSGTLLLTSCEQGLFCHLFRIVPHPTSCSQAAVLHLYRLHRGDTPRSVVSLSISKDCRLVAAASDHGTVHIWPISSYGGPLCVRTNCQDHVVNRLSRLERSAGMQECQVTRPHTANVSSSNTIEGPPNYSLHLLCPRLPPLPLPCTLYSYVQLKPLSYLPITNQALALVPFFFPGQLFSSSSSYIRTEGILVLSPDSRLLQYVLSIHPDPQSQVLLNRTELDGPFVIEKRPLSQWRLPSFIGDYSDHTLITSRFIPKSKNLLPISTHCVNQTAMLQSVIPDISEYSEQFHEGSVATPRCWFSNIEISSQISSTSGIRRQERFTISTYQSKEPADVNLEVLQKCSSISNELFNLSWLDDDRPKGDLSSTPVRVPYSEQRIQICNSFCGSSISHSLPGSTDNVMFSLAHAIQDEDVIDGQILNKWEEPKTNYTEFMTRNISQIRLQHVSGSDNIRSPLLPTSTAHSGIPEDKHTKNEEMKNTIKQGTKQEKKKSRKS